MEIYNNAIQRQISFKSQDNNMNTQNKKESFSDEQNVELKGLETISNQNKYLVNKTNSIKHKAQEIKQEYAKWPASENAPIDKLFDDETIVHIYDTIKAFYGDDNNDDFIMCWELPNWFSAFKNSSKEEIEKFLSSKYIQTLLEIGTRTKDRDGASYLCSYIPTHVSYEHFDIIEKHLHNKIFKSCFVDYFSQNDNELINVLCPDKLEDFVNGIGSVVNEFGEKENAKLFEDSILKRNLSDRLKIIEILNKRIDNLKNDELEQFSKIANELISAKDSNGVFIFGHGTSSDDSLSGMINGIEKMLDTMQYDKEEFKQLMYLLTLAKERKIPSFVLSDIAKKGKISNSFMDIVNNKEKGIPLVKCCNTKDEAQLNSEEGDVVEVNKELYLKTQNKLIKLNLDKETFTQLFPEIESFAISQGDNGNCYLISAIYDFMKTPYGRAKIYQMFSMENNDIIVTIPDAKEFPIRFSNTSLNKNNKNVNASCGIQMLEEAYSQTRALKYGTKNDLQTVAGGEQMLVYNAFLGNKNAKSYKIGENDQMTKEEISEAIKQFDEEIEENTRKIEKLKAAARIYKREQDLIAKLTQKNEELESYKRCAYEDMETNENIIYVNKENELLDILIKEANNPLNIISTGTKPSDSWLDKDKLIVPCHAYSINSINKAEQTIKIVNPYNSAFEVEISFDEFKKYFNGLNVVELS